MVQEFTGIPAPPFAPSSFPRSRLDLFGNSATFRTHFDSHSSPYLLRPFALKNRPPLTPATPSTSFSNNATISSPIVSAPANVNSENLGLFNPMLDFRPQSSHFHPSLKLPVSNSGVPGHLKMGGCDEFGSVNENLLGIQSSSDYTLAHNGFLRSISGGNYNSSQRVGDDNNGKANFSGLDFHGDKGTDNVVATRTEGMMDSWICSSD